MIFKVPIRTPILILVKFIWIPILLFRNPLRPKNQVQPLRGSIAKDPSPSQLPSSEKSLTEDTPPPEDTYAPPPVVQKPTPDPAVVDFLNGLIVQGVKSKGDRHAALMNGNVYNVNSIVSDELAIRLTEVDGGARHLIFKDKNGVRYRKPY